MQYTIKPLHEQALIIDYGNLINKQINILVMQLFNAMQTANIPYVRELVPAYSSLTVFYDALNISTTLRVEPREYIEDQIAYAIKNMNTQTEVELRSLEIPVCYDECFALDLAHISKTTGIAIPDIIQKHSANAYHVYLTGFLPGFAYMGTVDAAIALPRKKVPEKVVAGSVGIAGSQTGIYPVDSPGGWLIVGRTPVKLFNPEKENPFMIRAGDEVTFKPITLDEFNRYTKWHP